MAVFNAKLFGLVLVAFAAPGARGVGAVRAVPGQPITLDAQSFDGTANAMVFRRIRITQGTMSISADLAQALGQGSKPDARLNFDDSLWTFRGNVKIVVDDGELTSDDAQINFAKQQLAKAVVNGKPAAFEQRIEKSGKVAHGRADTIDYDAGKGTVRLSKNAWLSDGQTEMRGETLKYDFLGQILKSESSDQSSGSQRVHIVITPPPSKP